MFNHAGLNKKSCTGSRQKLGKCNWDGPGIYLAQMYEAMIGSFVHLFAPSDVTPITIQF